MPYCTKCGKESPGSARFCTTCGAPMPVRNVMPSSPPVSNASARKTVNSWMIIAIVAIAGLAVAGYFIFIDKNKKEDTKTAEAKQDISTNVVEPAPAPVSRATENNNPSTVSDTLKKSQPETVPAGIHPPGLYPQASERYLTQADLAGLGPAELKIMRNEIYARHGYIFQKEDMRQYFSAQQWYQPLFSNVDNLLSAIEKTNIYLIKDNEK